MKSMQLVQTRGRDEVRRLCIEWSEGEPFRPRVVKLDGHIDPFPWPGMPKPGWTITKQREKEMKLRKQIAIVACMIFLVGCTQDDQKASQNPPGSTGMAREVEPPKPLPPPSAAVPASPAIPAEPSPPPPPVAPSNPLPVLPTNVPAPPEPVPTNLPPDLQPTNPPTPPTNADATAKP